MVRVATLWQPRDEPHMDQNSSDLHASLASCAQRWRFGCLYSRQTRAQSISFHTGHCQNQ